MRLSEDWNHERLNIARCPCDNEPIGPDESSVRLLKSPKSTLSKPLILYYILQTSTHPHPTISHSLARHGKRSFKTVPYNFEYCVPHFQSAKYQIFRSRLIYWPSRGSQWLPAVADDCGIGGIGISGSVDDIGIHDIAIVNPDDIFIASISQIMRMISSSCTLRRAPHRERCCERKFATL